MTSYAPLWCALAALLGLGAGAAVAFAVGQRVRTRRLRQLEQESDARLDRRLAEEERSRRLALLEEKDAWDRQKGQQEAALEARLAELAARERAVASRDREVRNDQEECRKEWARLRTQERRLKGRERVLQDKEKELGEALEEYRQRLELASNLTTEEAREQLLEHVSGEVQARMAAMIRAERSSAREEADREAQKIIAQAIQRCAVEEVVQLTTSSVTLPSEGIKSRIIGKEGRNVRAFELATGVKVVVDDTPDTVLLSSYDPARREVAARAMAQLIADASFTPNRIDEVVARCQAELEADMAREGLAALQAIGATEHHRDLPFYVGMLKYRASYGQNLLQHSLEVAQLAGLMAAEIGLDVRLARRAGLLHDIGKTVSREMEGSHVELGVELAERFGEDPAVREVIAEHHDDSDRLSPVCFLVKAADTISSTRPGGRREDLEGYARRIMRLEEIANSFDGVKDVYAINAGREIRVMVRGDRISDDDAEMLAFDIAERVKNELTFAGQVKVMVVRETRVVRYTGRLRSRRGVGRRHRPARRARGGFGES